MPMTVNKTNLNKVIKDLEKKFPEFLRATDLIRSGLFRSRSDLSWATKRNQAPPSIKLSAHKVIFPRDGLIMWLKAKAGVENDQS